MSNDFKVISHLNLANVLVTFSKKRSFFRFLQKILNQPLWSINHFWLVVNRVGHLGFAVLWCGSKSCFQANLD